MTGQMRSRTLLTQVLAVNTALVALTAFMAALVARDRLKDAASTEGLLLIALAVSGVVLLNSILLRKRLAPIERLVDAMSGVDLANPGKRADVTRGAADEVRRLTADFNRMLERLEEERRQSGRAVLRAQEQERSRIAQDLHDEVNQALTGVLLRLQATIGDAPPGLQRGAERDQGGRRPGDGGAPAPRPPAAPDRARRPRARARARLAGGRLRRPHGHPLELPPPRPAPDPQRRGAARDLPRHAGEPVQRRPARLAPATSTSSCRSSAAPCCACATTGAASSATAPAASARGVSGMRERALLVGGRLTIFSEPGDGTTIELTMGAT